MKQVYKITLKQDSPYPVVDSIIRGTKQLSPQDIPERVFTFLDLVKENNECYRTTAFNSLNDYAACFKKKEDYSPGIQVRGGTRVRKGILTFSIVYDAPAIDRFDPEYLPTLPAMKNHYDGAHCGLGDWYPEIEKGLQTALRSGEDFTTGWYSSKKEIASARISRCGRDIKVEVSVNNDNDVEGMSSITLKNRRGLETIRKTIYQVWDYALENQKDNEIELEYMMEGELA